MWIGPRTNWQAGDGITEGDMNRIEGNLDNLRNKAVVKVPVGSWSSTVPYTQTVSIASVLATDTPVLQGGPDPNAWGAATPELVKAAKKAWGYVDRVSCGNGTLTLYCYRGKPAADFWVAIKGA